MFSSLTNINLIHKWNQHMVVLYEQFNHARAPVYNYKLALLDIRQRNTKPGIATFIRKMYLGYIL